MEQHWRLAHIVIVHVAADLVLGFLLWILLLLLLLFSFLFVRFHSQMIHVRLAARSLLASAVLGLDAALLLVVLAVHSFIEEGTAEILASLLQLMNDVKVAQFLLGASALLPLLVAL